MPGEVSDSTCMSMPAASISANLPVADVGELGEDLGEAAAGLLGLLFALAAGAFEKFRRGEMLFQRYGSHVGAFPIVF